jgi:multiple sugar transport system permease protein
MVGFSRIPVLVERIVYYHEEVPALTISPQMSAGYTIIVSLIVSMAALLYLRVSGAFGGKKEAAQ